MRLLLSLLLLASSLYGASSLQLASGVSGFASFGSSSPYSRAAEVDTSMRWEFRLHGNSSGAAIITPGSRSALFATNGSTFWVFLETDGTLWATDWFDNLPDSSSTVNISGRSDIVVRIVRDVALNQFWVEIQNIDGSGYVQGGIKTISSRGTGSSSGGGTGNIGNISLAGGNVNARLAWLRWRTGTATAGVGMPADYDSAADLADWEFENNGNDSSGHSNTMSLTGASYATSFVYAPGCSGGPFQSFRAGDAAVLSAASSIPLNGVNSLTYLWQQTSGPTTLTWSSHTTVNPTIRGLAFGTYTFSLRVTDSDGQSSSCTVREGAVATDSKGIVIVPSAWAEHRKLLGPMLRYGASPWRRYNEMFRGWADKQRVQYGSQAVVNGVAGIWRYWDVQAGSGATVSTTTGSKIMTVAGGNAQTIFCGGGTTPAQNTYIIVWWGASEQNRHGDWVKTCDDSSHITVNANWVASMGSQTSKHFAIASDTEFGRWGNISTNANYYDNVMALYALYLCSGDDTYLTAARLLADMWWDNPNIDHGYGCDLDGMQFCGLPRLQAQTGLYMRALDGRSDMFTGLDRMAGLAAYLPEIIYASGGVMGDMREEGYRLSQIALCAMYSPNIAGTCKTWTQHSIANFVRQQRAAGNWETLQNSGGDNGYTGSLMDGRYRGTVTVTNGSNVVMLTGTTSLDSSPAFNAAEMGPGRRFYTVGSVTDPATFDAAYYTPTYVSPTQITLDRPYSGCSPGPSCSGRYWETGDGWMGFGTQAFMMGIDMRAMYYGSLAMAGFDGTSQANARLAVTKAAGWLVTTAYNPTRHDIWYGIGYGGVCPVGAYCDAAGGNPDRNLQGEILGALALSQTITYSSTVATVADDLLGAAWADAGEPGYANDAYWLRDWYTGGFQFAFDGGKYLGFWWGFGGSPSHTAQRLGNVDGTNTRTPKVSVRFADHSAAVSARLTVVDPQGTATQYACASSPCSISYDATQGGYLLRKELLNGSGAVVMATEFEAIR